MPKVINCPNCQSVIHVTETSRSIDCPTCGKKYRNPYYYAAESANNHRAGEGFNKPLIEIVSPTLKFQEPSIVKAYGKLEELQKKYMPQPKRSRNIDDIDVEGLFIDDESQQRYFEEQRRILDEYMLKANGAEEPSQCVSADYVQTCSSQESELIDEKIAAAIDSDDTDVVDESIDQVFEQAVDDVDDKNEVVAPLSSECREAKGGQCERNNVRRGAQI